MMENFFMHIKAMVFILPFAENLCFKQKLGFYNKLLNSKKQTKTGKITISISFYHWILLFMSDTLWNLNQLFTYYMNQFFYLLNKQTCCTL